jgi:hypothetical protein
MLHWAVDLALLILTPTEYCLLKQKLNLQRQNISASMLGSENIIILKLSKLLHKILALSVLRQDFELKELLLG